MIQTSTLNTPKTNHVRRLLRPLFTPKGCIAACLTILMLFLIYDFVVLPRLDTWGATPEEAAMPLPGDSLVPGPGPWQMTVATTIKAPPEKIFPYFAQMGQDKAGFYSFDWLERSFGFGIHNNYTIEPKWQDVKPGDFCTFHKAGMGMRIAEVTTNRHLAMVTNGLDPNHPLPPGKWEMLLKPLFPPSKGDYVAWNWDFNLVPQTDGSTRVIVRCHTAMRGSSLAKFFAKHAFALPSDIMDIEMLKRVKGLAEGTYPLHS
jgi:hypothetical protein